MFILANWPYVLAGLQRILWKYDSVTRYPCQIPISPVPSPHGETEHPPLFHSTQWKFIYTQHTNRT